MRAILLTLLLSSLAAGASAAEPASQPTGLRFDVAGSVGRDDNLFRLPERQAVNAPGGEGARGDNYQRAEIGANAEAALSRQRIGLDIDAYAVRYDRYGFLDHEGGAVRGYWRWQIGSPLDGNMEASYSRRQSQLSNLQTPVNDITTTRSATASASYHLGPRVSLLGDLSTSSDSHSDQSRRQLDRTIRRLGTAVDYRTPAGTRFALEGGFYDVAFDQRVTVDGSRSDYGYGQIELHLVADLKANPRHWLELRAGIADQQHDDSAKRAFTGFTGGAKYRLNLKNKSHLALHAWRDAIPIDDITSSYIQVDGARAGYKWAMTRQLAIDLSLQREQRDFLGQPEALSDALRTDTVHSYVAALVHRPNRTLSIELAATRSVRDSNFNDRDYHADELAATLRLAL